jgi:hypothetical protein
MIRYTISHRFSYYPYSLRYKCMLVLWTRQHVPNTSWRADKDVMSGVLAAGFFSLTVKSSSCSWWPTRSCPESDVTPQPHLASRRTKNKSSNDALLSPHNPRRWRSGLPCCFHHKHSCDLLSTWDRGLPIRESLGLAALKSSISFHIISRSWLFGRLNNLQNHRLIVILPRPPLRFLF